MLLAVAVVYRGGCRARAASAAVAFSLLPSSKAATELTPWLH